jgi:hypothetical protein
MKKLAILVFAFGALAANAHSASTERLIESTGGQRGKQTSALSPAVKSTEIVKGNVAYGGVAVQVVKAKNPLQLVNPAAPAKYGSAENNVMRESWTGRVCGLKIFSLRF